jgi:tetratricopeptide (TPR) repeat protein
VSQSDFVTRGQTLVSSGQFQEAVKVCRLGLLGRPTTVEGRVVLGQALLALKRYDEVLAEMRVALELDHSSISAQMLKGEALLRKGDAHGAIDALGKLRAQGLGDAQVDALLAEAERLVGRSGLAIDLNAQMSDDFGFEQGTKNYPTGADGHGVTVEDLLGGEYTKPTSIATTGRKRTGAERPAPEQTPSPAMLAVGDHSGTVEVDPDVDVIESRGEDDFGDLVGPPIGSNGAPEGPRIQTQASLRAPKTLATAAAVAARKSRRDPVVKKDETSTVELGDEEMLEIDDTHLPEPRARGRGKRGAGGETRNLGKPLAPVEPPAPAHLAQLITSQPHVVSMVPSAPLRLPPEDVALAAMLPAPAPEPRGEPLAPAPLSAPEIQVSSQDPLHAPEMMHMYPPPQLPPPQMAPHMQQPAMQFQQTLLALPSQDQLEAAAPPVQLPPHLQSSMAAAHPTMALGPAPQSSAATVDALFNGQNLQAQQWGGPPPGAPGYHPGKAGADEQTRQAHELDPQIAAMLAGQGAGSVPAGPPGPAVFPGPPSAAATMPARAGMRKARSRLQILVWVMIGALVIGGGVFAGFQIRAIRLRRQIAAARDRAVDVAQADTWQGWLGARDSLYSIAQASPTVDNRAALAHARGVLAFELGDGVVDAKTAVDALADQSSVDLDVARAYVALALSDAKTAHEASERAYQSASDNAAVVYVSGEAALLAGDVRGAITLLHVAVEREARPFYVAGLARALGASAAWDEALTAIERVHDNPAGLITKAVLLASSGRVAGGPAGELRAQLAKLIADGQKPGEDHASPSQVAYAGLALAQLDFARNELGAAHAEYLALVTTNLDDQRFSEELVETGFAIGEGEAATKAAQRVLEKWPTSRRARTTLAQIWLAAGKATTALDLFSKVPDTAAWPKGQTVRGVARLATGDIDGARADFDAAIKKLPGFEPAVIARTWLDLGGGDVEDARKRIEPKLSKTPTTAMVAVYAAVLRASGDPAQRDKAKAMLERVVVGPPSAETALAQLELARIERDVGDLRAARAAYDQAIHSGNVDARLESALLLIETGDPKAARETLEQLLKEAGANPSAVLLLEAARARTLVGDHPGAAELLATAAKTTGVIPWHLARERGRLALRKSDTTTAAQALERALEGCGADLDTFILAADTVATDERQAALTQKLKFLLPTRLKGRAESQIVTGKLELAAGKQEDAERAYGIARDALKKEKASPRRRAQADYGLAAIAYFKRDDPTAQDLLAQVMIEDPSIYSAYLFAAEIAKPHEPRKALDLALQATAHNPDSIDGWKLVGTLASQLGDHKLLATSITRVGDLAPGSETLKLLKDLK